MADMKNLENNTRVSVTEKKGRVFVTWYGTIKAKHQNVTPPSNAKGLGSVGYSIKPEGEEFSTMKVRHYTLVKLA
ncbi:MAG: hypothetical protein AAB438_01915 [Patescibacteria group bacterium]